MNYDEEGATMIGSDLYPPLATGLVLALIFFDYISKLDTDHFQRKIYLSVLIFTGAAIILNSAAALLDGRPGAGIHIILQVIHNFFFISQNFSYYLAVVLIDYITNRNSARTGKLTCLVLVMVGLNVVILICNIFFGFYFYIAEDNRFVDGPLVLLRFYLGYIAILMVIVDVFLSAKYLRTAHIYLLIFFAFMVGAGAVLDLLFPGGHLIWAFFTGGLLYGYFYIIRRDTTQDNITGIGNRSSLTEFVNRTARMSVKQSYAMALFNINGLKKINDTHGQEAGDQALVEMAEILKKCSRQSDFVARIGGDEFLIAIKAKFDIERLLARILRALETNNQKPGRLYTLSISYGYATYTTKTDTSIEEFLQRLNDLVFQHKTDQRREEAARVR